MVSPLDALETDAGLLLVELAALEVALAGGLLAVGVDLIPVPDLILPLLEEGLLGREHHVADAEERVGAGGEDGHRVAGVDLEVDLDALGAADPVALLDLDAVDEVHIVQIVDQALGVLRDAEHPLALFLLHDGAAAALAHALDDLFVGEDALAAGAPVDGHGGLIGHVVLEELEEDPLRPLIVGGVGGIDTAIPVKAVAEHLELIGEGLDVVLRDDGGVDMVLDGVVFGGQTEGVKPDREEHVVALHAALAADDVHRRERARVADVQTLSGGIRELDEAVELRAGIAGDGGIGLGLLPLCLPW